jgi:hypothetical protein
MKQISLPFVHVLYSPLLGPGLFFSFVTMFTQTVGLLGGVPNEVRAVKYTKMRVGYASRCGEIYAEIK